MKRLLLLFLLWLALPWTAFATGTLMDFEDGQSTEYNPVNEQTRGFDDFFTGCCTHSVVSPGLLGSNYCLRSYVESPNTECGSYTQHSNHNWREDNDPSGRTQGIIIQEAADANRFSFYALFPAITPDDDFNYNVGTYTNTTGQRQDGVHYYHYFRLYSDGVYPTHLVCNTHPQNLSGSGIEVPDDPETWDYMPGLTRFYLQLYEEDQPATAFSIYYDNLIFYTAAEAENDETVNSIWVGYMGSNNWRMGFAINCQHTVDCATKSHDFQLRYSTSPITNANFSSATLVGTYNFDSGTYNQVPISFSIANTDTTGATHYYFAVQDTDEAYDDYVTKIDYEFADGDPDPDTTPPTVTITTSDPQSVSTDSVTIEFTDSDDTGVTSRKWRIGSAPDASNGTACTSPATVTGLSIGANTVYIGAGDAAGNWRSDSITVNYSPVASGATIINSGFRGGGGVR